MTVLDSKQVIIEIEVPTTGVRLLAGVQDVEGVFTDRAGIKYVFIKGIQQAFFVVSTLELAK